MKIDLYQSKYQAQVEEFFNNCNVKNNSSWESLGSQKRGNDVPNHGFTYKLKSKLKCLLDWKNPLHFTFYFQRLFSLVFSAFYAVVSRC